MYPFQSGLFPLVEKYFSGYLLQLAHSKSKDYAGRFSNATWFPADLERRLTRIEHLGLTSSIVKEIGSHDDPFNLDNRLLDAWAEIRLCDQLVREHFMSITKVVEIADFTAVRNGEKTAFQVTRSRRTVNSELIKDNTAMRQEDVVTGSLTQIHNQYDDPVGKVFWSSLDRKNGKFRSWEKTKAARCITMVNTDPDLQDPIVRHIACQQIREGIHSLTNIHFEELLWLPDLGNGAWFYVGASMQSTRCFADWSDEFGSCQPPDERIVNRREVDLDSPIDKWK